MDLKRFFFSSAVVATTEWRTAIKFSSGYIIKSFSRNIYNVPATYTYLRISSLFFFLLKVVFSTERKNKLRVTPFMHTHTHTHIYVNRIAGLVCTLFTFFFKSRSSNRINQSGLRGNVLRLYTNGRFVKLHPTWTVVLLRFRHCEN